MEDIIKIFGGSFVAGLVITALIHAFKKHGFGFINIVKNTFGALFLFSASVKAIDPLGTAYKMGEYFDAFHMSFLHDYSLIFSVIMIVAEFLLGIALIIGYKKNLTLILLFIMNIFFTFLTGFTTVTGKVTDCGCFGDFIKQTPKESFIKDLILVALLVIIFLGRNRIKEVFNPKTGMIITAILGIVFLYFNFSNFYFDKPIVDFRPYAIGNDINALRVEVPDKLDYGFVFKNTSTGETKRVVMNEYSKFKEDPAWEFTNEQDNIVLEKGVEAKIANYAAYNELGDDVTDELLSFEGYSIWVLSRKIDETNDAAWDAIKPLEDFANANEMLIYAFSSSVFAETTPFKAKHNLTLPFYEADEIFIKTIVRANPGVVLLKNGVVVAKWHHKHLPTVEEIKTFIK